MLMSDRSSRSASVITIVNVTGRGGNVVTLNATSLISTTGEYTLPYSGVSAKYKSTATAPSPRSLAEDAMLPPPLVNLCTRSPLILSMDNASSNCWVPTPLAENATCAKGRLAKLPSSG